MMPQRKPEAESVANQNATSLTFDSEEQRVFLNLWRTYDCLKAIEDETFARFDISPQQYNALRLLSAAYPTPIQTLNLAKQLITRSPDITRLLDRLEKADWIQRTRPANNRRIVEVIITSSGLQLLSRMQAEIMAMHHEQLGHLSERQRKQLVMLLRAARRPHDDATCNWLQ